MDQEVGFGPLPPVADDPAAWNQEVNVGVVGDHSGPEHVLSEAKDLEDSDETDLGTEEPLVPGEGHESLGRCLEEKRIDRFLTVSEGRSERFRDGHGGHKIRNRE